MNTLRKMRKNAKALSPVVASIILIAVTVAVSIAVAAWMGALVVGNMNTEALKITNADFDLATNAVTLTVKNPGSSAIVISDAYIGSTDVTADSDLGAPGLALDPNAVDTVTITAPTGITFVAGYEYQFKLVSSKGNPFVWTATAPLS